MSEQWVILGDTTEGSLYSLAIRGEADVDALRTKCKRLSVIPFESDYAFMLTINKCPLSVYDWWMKNEKDNKEQQDETKEKIIDDKDDDDDDEEIEMIFLKEEDIDIPFWLNETEKVAELGLRALALAQCRLKRKKKKKNEEGKQDEEDQIETPTVDEVRNNREKYPFTIIGVVGIFDPPRPQSLRAVKACKRAKIDVIMITGDHARTASIIGQLLGIITVKSKKQKEKEKKERQIQKNKDKKGKDDDEDEDDDEQDNDYGENLLTSTQIQQMNEEQLEERLNTARVIARATPADKLRIVKALQRKGKIVAMTGDGVNDAPALKQAHAGVAMGISGTEVAKEASKLVLLDDNFSTIVKAVEEGRIVYDAIKRSITYILPTNTAEALTLFASSFISPVPPITALQILWINTITSVTLSSLIPFQRGDNKQVLRREPRDVKRNLLTSTIGIRSLLVGMCLAAMVIGWFYSHVDQQGNNGGINGTIELSEDFGLRGQGGGFIFNNLRKLNIVKQLIRKTNSLADLDKDDPLTHRYSALSTNMIVLSEITFLFNTVYLKESSIRPQVFRDIGVVTLICILILIAAQILITYTPGLNTLFGMGPLKIQDWGIAILVAILIFLIVEIEKALRRIVHKHYDERRKKKEKEEKKKAKKKAQIQQQQEDEQLIKKFEKEFQKEEKKKQKKKKKKKDGDEMKKKKKGKKKKQINKQKERDDDYIIEKEEDKEMQQLKKLQIQEENEKEKELWKDNEESSSSSSSSSSTSSSSEKAKQEKQNKEKKMKKEKKNNKHNSKNGNEEKKNKKKKQKQKEEVKVKEEENVKEEEKKNANEEMNLDEQEKEVVQSQGVEKEEVIDMDNQEQEDNKELSL
ncbi:MAG: putative Cation-transporting ATPase pma1 [Streblomastix strix]|uniref:Putative Cation-transporting ATPase pma1 n=1 Tax=Streblomastix strix TaxID=222440 RepID=A0A5J4WL58_9EUKA|nr:MAG: putative Cation-transporting ATPase pma1 [Streblomastix strix]